MSVVGGNVNLTKTGGLSCNHLDVGANALPSRRRGAYDLFSEAKLFKDPVHNLIVIDLAKNLLKRDKGFL